MNNITLIYLYILTLGAIIFVSLQWNKKVLIIVGKCSSNLRNFISVNASFFKIAFIFVFFLEQLFFIIIMALYLHISLIASVVVGIFSLIVITTASFQSFIWEYKYQISEGERNLLKSSLKYVKEYSDFIERYLNSKK